MKRYLVIAASLTVLGMGSAHAQVFPSTTQDNSARITQTGNNNSAIVDQAVGAIINGQGQAEIIQNGNRNEGKITQTSATSPMASGFANQALIHQRRSRGVATIDQIHDYERTRENRATIVQITLDAEAAIEQRGDRNTATIRQNVGSVAPIASIDQNGNRNTAIVRQAGANGVVQVLQGTYVAGAGASPQMSFGNVTVDNDGSNANIFVSQLGQGHTATVFEDGANGLVNVNMAGAFNSATVDQQSTDGVINITSTAASFTNFANVTQGVSDSGSVTNIDQSGSNSVADVEQLDGSSLGGSNLADIDQSGNGSFVGDLFSSVLQNGGGNTALVDQASAYAQSTVVQNGAGHTANVAQ